MQPGACPPWELGGVSLTALSELPPLGVWGPLASGQTAQHLPVLRPLPWSLWTPWGGRSPAPRLLSAGSGRRWTPGREGPAHLTWMRLFPLHTWPPGRQVWIGRLTERPPPSPPGRFSFFHSFLSGRCLSQDPRTHLCLGVHWDISHPREGDSPAVATRRAVQPPPPSRPRAFSSLREALCPHAGASPSPARQPDLLRPALGSSRCVCAALL